MEIDKEKYNEIQELLNSSEELFVKINFDYGCCWNLLGTPYEIVLRDPGSVFIVKEEHFHWWSLQRRKPKFQEIYENSPEHIKEKLLFYLDLFKNT